MRAKFQCLKCLYTWESKPGPTTCPICEHLYVKWLNYEELYKLVFSKWDDRTT